MAFADYAQRHAVTRTASASGGRARAGLAAYGFFALSFAFTGALVFGLIH